MENELQQSIGFILVRHVNSFVTNKYWIQCVACIRKFYDEEKYKIVIIDDNSDPMYLTNDNSNDMKNVEIVLSEYPSRAELLPYYYFWHNKYFDKAIIIHDSIFFNKFVDFDALSDDKCKFLFHFDHDWDQPEPESKCIRDYLSNSGSVLDTHNDKSAWYGCFGVQSIITHSFLVTLSEKYNFFNLIQCVDNRAKRMHLERIFAVLCTKENPILARVPSIFGKIHDYCKWGVTYSDYRQYHTGTAHLNLHELPVIKVWSSR